MAVITPFRDIDVNQIQISEPKRNASGGLLANVTYGRGGGPLIFKSPKMPCPFGISEFTDKDKNVGTKWSLSLSFRHKETNQDVADFYDKMEEINERMIDLLHQSCVLWFPTKNYSREFVGELFRPLITPSKKAEYAPTLHLKITERVMTQKDGSKTRELSDVFNTRKERIDARDVAKGDSVIALITPGTVYLAGKNVGMTLKMQQAVRFPSTNIRGCVIDVSESPSAPSAPAGDDDAMDDATSPAAEDAQYEEGEMVPQEETSNDREQ